LTKRYQKNEEKLLCVLRHGFLEDYEYLSPEIWFRWTPSILCFQEAKRFYQFTAIDVLTKRKVMRVYPSESSRNGAHFLQECLLNFPFLIKAVQTDNGSTFLKEFDKLCREKGLPHYFIYPRTPKQNTYVEISHEADKREFYQQGNVCCLLPVMQRKIREWEDVWNDVRPHEALGQLTPSEYLLKLQTSRIPTKDVIILQV